MRDPRPRLVDPPDTVITTTGPKKYCGEYAFLNRLKKKI